MNILMLNTFDEVGGAARAALRLLNGVREQNIDAKLLVQFKTGDAEDVICIRTPVRKLVRRLKVFLGLLPVRMYPNKPENNFSPSLLPDRKHVEIDAVNPDIIHLHWLCAGFLRIETLSKLNKPLIWTMHDSWPFTGGCHVPYDCTEYRQNCGACPVLGSSRENDLSRRTWERKNKSWKELDMTVVAPSHWLADCARSSSLFRDARVEVIPNGLDTETFRPKDKKLMRRQLGLPQDRNIILFGAVWADSDPNKGFHLLKQALQALDQDVLQATAVIFGADNFIGLDDVEMPLINFGRIDDDRILCDLYSAADVFVAPSMLENLPNTIMEAMACGTPCVAFDQGGVPDLIDHKASGYLARPHEVKDLAKGISWILGDRDRYKKLSLHARQKVTADFNIKEIADRYITLYQELI